MILDSSKTHATQRKTWQTLSQLCEKGPPRASSKIGASVSRAAQRIYWPPRFGGVAASLSTPDNKGASKSIDLSSTAAWTSDGTGRIHERLPIASIDSIYPTIHLTGRTPAEMTSVSSRGTPHSPLDFETAADADDTWQHLDMNSYASSVGIVHSPASGSLNGYAVVGHFAGSDHAGLSPLNLDQLDQAAYSAPGFPDQTEAFAPAPSADGQFVAGGQNPDILTPQQYLFSQQDLNG